MTNSHLGTSIAGTSALVTDIDRRKALPIIRALGKEQVHVIGLSYRSRPMGAMSKYCRETHRCPDYRRQPQEFLQRLEELCARQRPDVLFPLEDELLELCIRYPETWEPYTQALLPGPGVFEQARDKWLTMKAAREAGIPVPKTVCPQTRKEVDQVAATWDGPAVIKPRKSSGSRGLSFVDNPADIAEVYHATRENFGPTIIQERIPAKGSGLGVSVLIDRDHKPVAVFGHRRLREYPITGGPSTCCESHKDPELVRQSLGLLEAMRFVGVAMVEFKVDTRTGNPVLMEVNPRFWGSLDLAVRLGVDFPVLYHKLALGMRVGDACDYPVGVRWRWLLGDIMHFLAKLRRLQRCPGFFTLSNAKVYSDVTFDDAWPTLGMVVEGLSRLVRHEKRR